MTPTGIKAFLPVLSWLPSYSREDLAGDGLAGLIVAIMLVPQGMAYALLAGLPPQVRLYASIVPLIIYGLLGSSRTLAVGPVAIVSLMVASTLGEVVDNGAISYLAGAVLLAFISGSLLLLMGLFRLGFLVNFLSHPVISGFTSAAALVIGFSQLKHLLGIDIPRSHLITHTLEHAAMHINQVNPVTILLATISLVMLLTWRSALPGWLSKRGLPDSLVEPLSKAGPLAVVLLTTVLVWSFGLHQSAAVRIVADIPAGLPAFTLPLFSWELIEQLLPAAFVNRVSWVSRECLRC